MQNLTDPFAKQLDKQRDMLSISRFVLDRTEKETEEWPEAHTMISEGIIPTLQDWRAELKKPSSTKLVPTPDRAQDFPEAIRGLYRIIRKINETFRPSLIKTLHREIQRTKNFGGVPWYHSFAFKVRGLKIRLRIMMFITQYALLIFIFFLILVVGILMLYYPIFP